MPKKVWLALLIAAILFVIVFTVVIGDALSAPCSEDCILPPNYDYVFGIIYMPVVANAFDGTPQPTPRPTPTLAPTMEP
jgi:hypothetical protein